MPVFAILRRAVRLARQAPDNGAHSETPRPRACAAQLAVAVGLVGLVACTPSTPEVAAERSEPARSEPAPAAADTDATAPADGIVLAYRFKEGERWVEAVDLELHSRRAGEAPGDAPTMVERRRERFEVLAASDGVATLQVTVERVELEPRGGPAVDSAAASAPPREALALERLALVGVPVTYRLASDGATLEIVDEGTLRAAAEARWDALRAEAGLAPATAEERDRWRNAVGGELTSAREWGIRPKLPRAPIAVGDAWTESTTTSTLFSAEVVWSIEHVLKAADGDSVTIARDGDAEFRESPAMARYLERADAGLAGELVIDRRSGALLRAETTVTALVEAAPQPEAGFDGGTLKMRRILKRRRLGARE
ncbi:MAG: hypothetical protein KC486_30990 [Myxococcales bacterium]|nr:hypothetical protein [Myxococcales bacterium]